MKRRLCVISEGGGGRRRERKIVVGALLCQTLLLFFFNLSIESFKFLYTSNSHPIVSSLSADSLSIPYVTILGPS